MFLINSIPDPPSREMSTITMAGFAVPMSSSAAAALAASPQISQVVLLVDQVRQPLAHQRMVINQ